MNIKPHDWVFTPGALKSTDLSLQLELWLRRSASLLLLWCYLARHRSLFLVVVWLLVGRRMAWESLSLAARDYRLLLVRRAGRIWPLVLGSITATETAVLTLGCKAIAFYLGGKVADSGGESGSGMFGRVTRRRTPRRGLGRVIGIVY